MSLLREIQDLSIDSGSDLEALLRKCRVLASRLKNDDLKNWVQWELDGYSKGVAVPDYRKFHCQCAGHFSGPFGREVRNAPIAETVIPEQLRKTLTQCEIRDGVSSLATTAQNSENGLIRYSWPAEASMIFGTDIYENLALVQGWMRLTTAELAGILSTVRNRILNFALEIESSNPNAGEAPANTLPVPKEHVAHIFNHYIYGNVGNVASGHNIHQTATVNVNQGDFKSLTA